MHHRLALLTAILAVAAMARPAQADDPLFDSGRLRGTAGIAAIEGAAGGGTVPWAAIAGYGTGDAIGGGAHVTAVRLSDFKVASAGVNAGFYNRLELSYARVAIDTGRAGQGLGIGRGSTIRMDVFGAKLRLLGDVVYGPVWLPQVAVGFQYKANDRGSLLAAFGARSHQGTDFYASATKLLLGQSVLLNATIRLTRANEAGLLGFGGPESDSYRPAFEGSAAWLPSRTLALGTELRTMPNALHSTRSSRWIDAFIAWFPTKTVSATLAYLDLGTVATRKHQSGVQISAQMGF